MEGSTINTQNARLQKNTDRKSGFEEWDSYGQPRTMGMHGMSYLSLLKRGARLQKNTDKQVLRHLELYWAAQNNAYAWNGVSS